MNLPGAIQSNGATHVRWRGRRLIYYGGCDYYRLTHHPKLLKAHARAAAKDGLGTGASRMTTGNHPSHDKLEASLVKFFDCKTATLIGDGYLANIALGQAVSGRFDVAFIDEKAHMSLYDAAKFVGCSVIRYRHCDQGDFAKRLNQRRMAKRIVLMTDGVFGATGRIAPLAALAHQLPRSGTLWIDDAHGVGVLGERLRGTVEQCSLGGRRMIQSIVFSKALGSFGGALLGPRWLRSALLDGNPVVTGSSSLPTGSAEAVLLSLKLLRTQSTLAKRLRRNTVFVKERLHAVGVPIGELAFPVFSLDCPGKKAIAMRRRLLAADIYPSCIRYPTGCEGAFYRFAISSEHTRSQLEGLVAALSAY
ncbi:MAG: pyridoxal phosphate-dependent aminotransferase family protein [Verrucomicrobiota bacterium]|nr:pyridoxal phosphate-dependent aminotransferase family protein [Verrucomicrobiota bacterium]MEE2941940.1 pyridoxal phosphate-dependent aminotransferase family protein [Verrucomicrobiota bacterium]